VYCLNTKTAGTNFLDVTLAILPAAS
jgi:hypothetical protein